MKMLDLLKKRGLSMLALAVAILGICMLSAPKASADTVGDWEGAKAAIITAYQNYETEVDVKKYKLNYATEYDELKAMMSEVVNETPYIFYAATSYTVSRNSKTNRIVKIGLGYTDEYKKEDGTVREKKIINTRIKLDAAISKAMECIDSGMTKVEKAMALHDYLVRNTTYAKNSTKPFRLTEVGVFLKNKANCQGYSLAYAILMQKAGIPVELVSSDEMSHMWNMIKIGGQWYHVDVTWDDPVDAYKNKDQYGVVKHTNFLCSSNRFEKTGHYGFDTSLATSTKHDKKYWKNINTSFYRVDGKWLYMTKKGIVEREKLVGGTKEVLYNVSGSNLVQGENNKFYFIAYNSVYLYDYTENAASQEWKATSKYSDEYSLIQIKYQDGYVYYRMLFGEELISSKIKIKEDGTI